jgi:uncharacterized protein YcbX
MLGEELNAAEVTDRGLLGDRAYALLDRSDSKVASAKNPRKWPQLFDFRAAFVEAPRSGAQIPPVRITLPDGTLLSSTETDVNQILSGVLKREVTLEAAERGQQEVVESTFPNPWVEQRLHYRLQVQAHDRLGDTVSHGGDDDFILLEPLIPSGLCS